jgi:hypothetical protein
MNLRERIAWAAVLGLSAAGAAGWVGWSQEAAARRQDRVNVEEAMRYLSEKANRGMFLEAKRARDEAARGTDRQ